MRKVNKLGNEVVLYAYRILGRYRFMDAILAKIMALNISKKIRQPCKLERIDRVWRLSILDSVCIYVPHPLVALSAYQTSTIPFGTIHPVVAAKPGEVILDVGAGIGRTTMTYSRMVGETGLVIAIEIEPYSYDCLRLNALKYAKSGIAMYNMGASDSEGVVGITTIRGYQGSTMLKKGPKMFLPVISIDKLIKLAKLPQPDRLAMNIEGAEIEALEGMVDTLKQCREVVISADHKRNGKPTARIVATMLEGLGYSVMVDDRFLVRGMRDKQINIRGE